MSIIGLRGFNLSTQQNRLWPLQSTNNSIYHAQCAIQISGMLNPKVLLQAIQSLVDRHSILRTTFYQMPGMDVPVQIINDHVEAAWDVVDLSHLDRESQGRQWQNYFDALQHERLNFSQSPLLHMTILRLAIDMHILLVSIPSLCADDSTLQLFITELSQNYPLAQSAASSTEEAEEPLQYIDVAAWQDELLAEEEVALHRQYWKKIDLLQGATLSLSLLGKGQGAENEELVEKQGVAFHPQVLDIPIDAHISMRIKKLTEEYHVSYTDYLLTCWYATCAKIVGSTDIVIGAACDGRFNEELFSALGLYKRFVPININFADDVPFEQILLLMRANVAKGYEEQLYFSWADSVSRTKLGDALSYFPVSFEYQSWPASLQAGALTFSLLKAWSCIEPFVLKLSVYQVGERLQLAFHYDPLKVTGEQASYLATLFSTLLNNATAQPQARMDALSLLSSSERSHLLTSFSVPQRTWPKQGLHQLFEAQVQQHPDQLAAIGLQEQLTYRQLNEQANQLAHVLRQQGVGPNVLVGLYLSRQARMLVGMLAILKAGGAYLPLDMGSPAARLSYQLQDSQVTLLLTQEESLSQLPAWNGRTLCLEELEAELSTASRANLQISSSEEDLAYIIYTSGSTGVPKGVMIRQRSVVNYTRSLCETLGSEPGWHYATVSTLAADLGNTAIFCALASGGCVQVLPYETVTSGGAMAQWATQHPIDVLKIVPSHLSALLESPQAHELLPRRALVLGGEALSGSLVERVRQLGATCQIYNHYGPTETTIGVLVNTLGSQVSKDAMVALGRPIANTQVYVLDRRLQLVPRGVVGELYIGGAGVAWGYLGQVEQTAERFVPHPYSEVGGERLYRTGDLVRYGQGEQIEFVGRQDGQVKLRGYRIELGEIEVSLRQHPQVRESVVNLQADALGETRLVSYVVSKQRVTISREQLEEWLRQRLPTYMLPTEYVQIDELPLTANGKIDRERLPRPEQRLTTGADALVQPRSPLEEMVAQLWRELLGISLIGVYDNFFALGGHSLLATRVVARLQTMLQLTLPVQLLFESPTVADLVQRIESIMRQGEMINIPPLVAGVRPEEIPLSFAQQRLWFLDRLQPDSTGYMTPRVQRFAGKLNTAALEQCFHELVVRHESLRTTFEEYVGQPVQVIHPAQRFSLPVLDLSGLAIEHREREARFLIQQEGQRPCNLAQGPLFRIYLLRLDPQEHLLLLTLHHIITDGWSIEILIRELTTLYQAFVAGLPSPLTPLPIQYVDYALWQREWLQGEALAPQLAYWRTQLTGVEPLAFPLDHPRPLLQTSHGSMEVHIVPLEIQESLERLSQQAGVTMFMLLLAAFQMLLQRYSGQNDISVGTPIANRTRSEVEGLIGFFVNTLVLRSDLSGDPSFKQFLANVRATCLQAYTHQDIPFEKVVEELEPDRDLNRSPLFQVWFVLHEASAQQDELTGLTTNTLAAEHNSSKFDLTLSLTQTAQGLRSVLEYNTDLFEAETIKRVLEHWEILLAGITHAPQAHLSQVPLLSTHERELLLEEWNATTLDVSQELCLHQLFEQQARQTPDVVALTFETQSLTYADLNRRANQLARHLRQQGVGPDQLVGLCMDRSIEMVIGILAVMKAGGAYVPLDISTPHERLSLILADIHATAILTLGHLQDALPHEGYTTICLDTDWAHIARNDGTNLSCNVSPLNLAYVIYTSGSTGKPKGVLVTHANVVHSTQARFAYYDKPVESYLLFSPFFFDSSVAGLFWTLCQGGRLVLLREDFRENLSDLPQFIMQQNISHMLSIPSLYALILSQAQPEQLASLQIVIVAGEACPVSLVQRHREVIPQTHLYNEYGPTEGSVWSSVYRYQYQELGTQVPIGRPIANVQIYLLDQAGQPVPIGVPGELCVGGRGIVRGYLDRADLTAEKFIPDPYSQLPGERLYKTGDLARYREDGSLDFIERIDQQVKVRGYRIELREIEAILRQHRAVFECVVLAREYGADDKRLIAYVVADPEYIDTSDKEFVVDTLRSFLRERLPEYMVPTQIGLLEHLPLTANGKVDQKKLPGPDWDGFVAEKSFVSPRNAIEEQIAAIWMEVLSVPHVSIHDNFFEMGGSSLLATRVVYQIGNAFHMELPLRFLFEAPTIESLAVVIVQLQAGDVDDELLDQLLAELDQTV
ncbi:non-ribosomal peptide synthetase [Ktedonobacteria bacterium brp13]|nr:non-ribosomal peptide synthetase [Ktedonobacteria bacterium brp13]